MEVVLLLVGILGVALIVVPRVQRRRSGARWPAATRRRRARGRQAKAAQAAVATTPVATWTPAEAAASRAGDWEVWDDELGWEGEDSTPTPQAEPVAEAAKPAEPEPEPDPLPRREPDREEWERWRAKRLSDTGQSDAPEPAVAAGGELPSVERWRERQSAPGEWADDDGLGWEGEAAQAEPVAWQRDEVAPVRQDVPAAPVRDFSGQGRPAPVEVARFEPAVRASVSAPEQTEAVPPAAVTGREWLADGAWEAHGTPATQTEGGSNGNGHGHLATAAAPRRGRRRLSPIALVALYALAGIAVVVLASTVLLGGSSAPKAKPAPTPQATATAHATTAPGSSTAGAVPAATPDPAIAAAERKAKAAARSFRRAHAGGVRGQNRAVAHARSAFKRHRAAVARRRAAAVKSTQPAYTPPPVTPVTPPTYSPPPAPAPAPAPRPNRCEFCIG